MNCSLKIVKERSIFLDSSFTEQDVNEIIKKLRYLNFQDGPIFLHINCAGGSFAATKKLYEAIILSPNKVIGIVIGNCFSGATISLQACHKRYASPLSKMGVHYISLPVRFSINDLKPMKFYIDELRSQYNTRKKNNQLIVDLLHRRMKIDKKIIRKLLIQERELSSKEALDLNLIDEIIKY